MKLTDVFEYTKINQKGLYQMMNDENHEVREIVTKRLNQLKKEGRE